MVRVLIADDHQMFIDGIRSLLAGQDEIDIVAQAKNGKEILEQLAQHAVDIILMDVSMPEMNGIEATRIIRKNHPATQVLMLTMHEGISFIQQVMEAGAAGYILKNTNKQELIRAIGTIAQGGTYFDLQVTQTIMKHMQEKAAGLAPAVQQLSKREQDILRLITQEYTTAEIAESLGIGYQTVETHRKNLLRKLNVRNTAGLVRYALQNGLAD